MREAGLDARVSIRVLDYRDLAGERFDAIASIGMVEHVGAERIDLYARRLAGLLSRAAGCSTTASRASNERRQARSRRATSSPTPTRFRSPECSSLSSAPAS